MILRRSAEPETNPVRRIVLVGASNLVRNIATVVQTACAAWGSPADLLMAAGHGRSYGLASHVLGRTLPGIVECGLWQSLAQRHPAQTAALVTDIGNDILYGADDGTIAAWVKCCLLQLRAADARIIITELPLRNLRNLETWRFRLFRTMLFPQSRLTLEVALSRATALNERIKELAAQHQATLVRPWENWYGFDPIHLLRKQQADAWSEVMSHWNPRLIATCCPGTAWNALYLRSLRPHRRRVVGVPLRRAQPCGQLANGTRISLY